MPWRGGLKINIAQEKMHEVKKQRKYGAIGGFWDQFRALAKPITG